jgi:hypothetical protein
VIAWGRHDSGYDFVCGKCALMATQIWTWEGIEGVGGSVWSGLVVWGTCSRAKDMLDVLDKMAQN